MPEKKKATAKRRRTTKKRQPKIPKSLPRLLLPAVTATTQRALGRRRQRRNALAIVFVSALLLGGLLGLVSWQLDRRGSFSHFSMAGVGINRSQPHDALAQKLENKVAAYRVVVHAPDGSEQRYSLSDMGISVASGQAISVAETAQAHESLLGRLAWWQHHTTPLPATIDKTKLAQFIDEKLTIVSQPAINAALVITDGQTSVTPARDGRAYTVANAVDTITTATSSLQPLSLTLTEQVSHPKISDQAVASLKQRIDGMLAQSVVLHLKDLTFVASPSDIGNWIDLPDFSQADRPDIEVNSGRVLAYLDELAAPYVAPGRSEVVMKDPSGQNLVLVHGQDGIDVLDKKAIAVDIASKLTAGQGFNQTLTIAEAPYDTVHAENYDKWLVADLTNKRMYAYQGSTLVRTFLISAGSPTYPTVLGEFKIYSKIRAQDMHGLNADGSTYFQPNVEWVNYFYGSYAIHGNYWRPSYWFGNVNSSHGCIGIMNNDAEWVYDWAPVGTPVITHS